MEDKYVTYLRSPVGQIKLTGDKTSVNSILFVFNDTEMENDDPNSSEYEPTIIVEGKDPNVSFIKGIFQSFGDAPDGFSEELKEFTWALSAEYLYQDSFAIRAGFFNAVSARF